MSEAAQHADFSEIRYAQCWEDADILVKGLNIQAGDTCLSIGSAGDNSLALLGAGAGRVIVLDLNPAQLACIELRLAAYRELEYQELLELMGSRPSTRRYNLYTRCRSQLKRSTREFWDAHRRDIENGIGGAGKFERYFALFRNRILPLIHKKKTLRTLMEDKNKETRYHFYDKCWNNLRWQLLFKIFFSRTVMGRMGRDPSFFRYVEGNVADRILARTRHALTELNPAENPYLQWILTGCHGTALPRALRPDQVDTIRLNLDKVDVHQLSLEQFFEQEGALTIDRFNLSDIFEYMSEKNYHTLLDKICHAGKPGGRLAYWNMLVPRRRPEKFKNTLKPIEDLSAELFQRDKAFFYSAYVVEELC